MKKAKATAEKKAARKKADKEEEDGRSAIQVQGLFHHTLADPSPTGIPNRKLDQFAVPCIPKTDETTPAVSDEDDKEIMDSYKDLV